MLLIVIFLVGEGVEMKNHSGQTTFLIPTHVENRGMLEQQ
jgi:hypothetical protein